MCVCVCGRYLCENDWGGFRSCGHAYNRSYDKTDYYGMAILDKCLNKPRDELEDIKKQFPDENKRPPLFFYRLDFANDFRENRILAKTAQIQSSIDNAVIVRDEAPVVRLPPKQVKCCATQMMDASQQAALLSFAGLGPIGLLFLYTLYKIISGTFAPKEPEPSFLTRAYLKQIKVG